MVNYISGLVFVILLVVGFVVLGLVASFNVPLAVVLGLAWVFFDVVISSSICLAAQWERAVIFRLGKYQDTG
jgi:hypothetical protein